MRLSPTGRAALWYAEHGFAVFRTIPGRKEPLGGRGENDATTDLETVERLYTLEPAAGVAVALRFTDNFVVDEDAKAFGDEWLADLELIYGKLPHTPHAISGSGNPGAHRWFRRTPELADVRARKLTHGVDLKGLRAGYVVVPPSFHPSGRRYQWEASCRIDEVPIADPPEWLVRQIKRKATKFTEAADFPDPVDPESFYLGVAFSRAGLLGERIANGKWIAVCPNEHLHQHGSSKTSTVLFAPEKPGGRGTFFCSHTSSCSEVWR
jgi:hypothetical protein